MAPHLSTHGNQLLLPSLTVLGASVVASGLSAVQPQLAVAVAVLGAVFAVWRAVLLVRGLGEVVTAQSAEINGLRGAGILRDPVTLLGNAEMLRAEWDRQRARYQRRGERFSLAVVNVSDQTQPGPITPAIAKSIAEEMNGLVRAEDQIYRVSENAFAVLLIGSDRDGAEYFLERARKQLRTVDSGPGIEPHPIEIQTQILEWHDQIDGYRVTTTRGTSWVADGPVEDVPERMILRWAGQRASSRRVRNQRAAFEPQQRAS